MSSDESTKSRLSASTPVNVGVIHKKKRFGPVDLSSIAAESSSLRRQQRKRVQRSPLTAKQLDLKSTSSSQRDDDRQSNDTLDSSVRLFKSTKKSRKRLRTSSAPTTGSSKENIGDYSRNTDVRRDDIFDQDSPDVHDTHQSVTPDSPDSHQPVSSDSGDDARLYTKNHDVPHQTYVGPPHRDKWWRRPVKRTVELLPWSSKTQTQRTVINYDDHTSTRKRRLIKRRKKATKERTWRNLRALGLSNPSVVQPVGWLWRFGLEEKIPHTFVYSDSDTDVYSDTDTLTEDDVDSPVRKRPFTRAKAAKQNVYVLSSSSSDKEISSLNVPMSQEPTAKRLKIISDVVIPKFRHIHRIIQRDN